MRRLLSGLLALVLAASLTACGQPPLPEDGKTQVVCTLFPYYDFARQIGGDDVDVTLVVPAGRETHSFEPTPMDVIRISQADVFIYNGGESEQLVADILDAAGEDIPCVLSMMDAAELHEEELVEGMQGGASAHGHHDHDEDEDDEVLCCLVHLDDDDDDDEDEHEHHHEHGDHCCCGHHHHHHDHDADEVFTSWGVETARKFTKAEVEHALTELDTGNYGMILRSKGIVDGGTDGWLEFDYVPGEWEVRARGADVGGKLVVIGSKLNEKAIAELFGC